MFLECRPPQMRRRNNRLAVLVPEPERRRKPKNEPSATGAWLLKSNLEETTNQDGPKTEIRTWRGQNQRETGPGVESFSPEVFSASFVRLRLRSGLPKRRGTQDAERRVARGRHRIHFAGGSDWTKRTSPARRVFGITSGRNGFSLRAASFGFLSVFGLRASKQPWCLRPRFS